jgi:hypothetical protein
MNTAVFQVVALHNLTKFKDVSKVLAASIIRVIHHPYNGGNKYP